MAELIANRLPEQLQSVGTSAAAAANEPLVAALLANGLDPTAIDAHGMTVRSVAERHGKDSKIYRTVAEAAAKRSAD